MSRSALFGSRAGTIFVSTDQVDASLAANLPVGPASGQTHRISVAGSFENSALVSPQNFIFEAGDYVRYDGNMEKWTPVIGKADIDDTAYGAGWNGDTLNAPSRNAVYDKFETLGTMSTQNANNVAITGGSIDGTAIGSTTLSTVKGSTVSTGLAAATSRLDISGVAVAAAGSDANINIDLTPKGTGEVNIPVVDIDGGAIDGTTIGATTPAAVTATTVATGVAAATSRLDISGTTVAAAGSDANISVTLSPKGAGGAINMSRVDIDGGAIDGTNITVGSGKTLDVSAGTLTLAADQISGDKVEGGTINAITINTLTSPSIVTVDNASTQTLNIPVTGADSGAHTIALQIDGDAGISVAATGDGAGHVGVKTIDIGTTAEANVVHIGGSTALVDITDAHWSITEAGVLSIVSMGANWTNAGRTVADAGTLTTADINGGAIDGTTIGGSTPAVGTFTTANATTFDTNVAAAGVTLAGTTLAADGTDANIDINITPKGTGSVVQSKVDINGGSIDGTTIGANSAAAGTFSALTVGSDAISLSVIQAQAIKYAIALGG